MDPVEVLRVLWRHRWYVLPAAVLSIAAAAYVFAFGPRSYTSNATYALVSPELSLADLDRPEIEKKDLNSNNPYLRSTDPNLIGSVVIARLNSQPVAEELARRQLGEYRVDPAYSSGGLLVAVMGSGTTPEQSLETTTALGDLLATQLRQIQTIDGADDEFLYTSVLVATSDRAVEQLSSRLRTLVVVMIGGVMLVFGAVSLGRWREAVRLAAEAGRHRAALEAGEPGGDSVGESPRVLHPRGTDA